MIRPAMILIVLLAASLGVTLFVVKYQVQDLENQLVALNREISDDRQAIHVLKAEWSHLNEPARLRKLAERYLGLEAVQAKQVGTVDEWFVQELPALGSAAPVAATTPLITPAREQQR